MNTVAYVDCQRIGIRSPRDVVSIAWEVDGCGGSTECEAWRAQHEMDKLAAAGYRLVSVRVIAHNGGSMDAVTVAAINKKLADALRIADANASLTPCESAQVYAALSAYDAQQTATSEDDKLLMELATPANADQAARMLRHPLVQALEFCEAETARTGSEFYRRLAGSIRKAHAELVETGRA